MGPQRARATAMISLVAGIGIAIFFFVVFHSLWGAAIVGLGALQSYQRLQALKPSRPEPSSLVDRPQAVYEEPVPPELDAKLAKAQRLLADDRYDEAGTLAELVLAERPPKRARLEALTLIGWAHLLEDRQVAEYLFLTPERDRRMSRAGRRADSARRR